MIGDTDELLKAHLLRADGQEDLCLAIYKPSSGKTRFTALICELVLPQPGERHVHGVVTFTGKYVLRAAQLAAKQGGGVAILHSHPLGRGWQMMSEPDRDAEASYAALVREYTNLPLVGLTLAGGSLTWSARAWTARGRGSEQHQDAISVRVVGKQFNVHWNNRLRPIPSPSPTLSRTTSCWGTTKQADIARLKVLVIGAGTLGHDVLVRLAATGLECLGVMDFDSLELENLDRLHTATVLDVLMFLSKLELADRECDRAATSSNFQLSLHEASICETASIQHALDYDLIFCCVDDHPWPRSILNTLAYTDLIPVIDGGVHVDAFEDGSGLRNATWRSHVLRPGRPCMACNGQLDLGSVHADKAGLYDDADYIAGLPKTERPTGQNVSLIASGAVGGLLAQFVSLLAAPAGLGEPGPVRFSYGTHWLEHRQDQSRAHCPVETATLRGDRRVVLSAPDARARSRMQARLQAQSRYRVRIARLVDRVVRWSSAWLQRFMMRPTMGQGQRNRHVTATVETSDREATPNERKVPTAPL